MSTVCLDLDGTLIDSAPDLATALNAVLEHVGQPPATDAEVRRHIGGGARALIRRVFSERGHAIGDLDALGGRFFTVYLEVLTERTVCWPGTIEALAALRDRGHALALTTNKSARPTARILEHLDLARWFDVVVAGDDLPVKKPDPRHLTEAVARSGGGPALLVGDSETDAAAAHAAGYPLIAVSMGYRTVPLADLRAVAVIDQLADLPAAVDRWLPRA